MALLDLPQNQSDQIVSDILDGIGINAVLNLTTTAVIGKVGANNLAQRKYIIIEAIDKNIKWGFDSTCPFDAFKNQLIMLPIGDNINIYLKMSSGTGSINIAEVG